MLTPVQYAERYWQLQVAVPNGPVTVRIDKYHLGSPTPAKDRLWSALRDHFAAEQRQTPGFRLQLTVEGQPVDFGSPQEMLFHVLRPFFGKGSPEQCQVVLQLVVLLGIKQPAELQGYANENLGLDCNGFVGNYLLHGRGEEPWTVLDGEGNSVGPNSLITQIFAQGNTVTSGSDMFPNRSYILVEVDAHGHVMPGGPGHSPGHIVITEPGRHQPHGASTRAEVSGPLKQPAIMWDSRSRGTRSPSAPIAKGRSRYSGAARAAGCASRSPSCPRPRRFHVDEPEDQAYEPSPSTTNRSVSWRMRV